MLDVERLQKTWDAGEHAARREFAGCSVREGALPAFTAYAKEALPTLSDRQWLEAKTYFTTAYLSEWDYITQNGHSRPL